ncbi:MAG: hypothetical protein AAF985_06580 [Bacteroidota bacterium]
MIKTVIKVGLLLIVGIVGYNYFFGNAEEKAQSKAIIGKTIDAAKAGVGLIKEEIDKFKEGKYDDALDKIGGLLSKAKDQAEEKGGDLLNRIEDWESNREAWQEKKEALKKALEGASEEEQQEIGEQIKELNEKGEKLEAEGKELQRELGQ